MQDFDGAIIGLLHVMWWFTLGEKDVKVEVENFSPKTKKASLVNNCMSSHQ